MLTRQIFRKWKFNGKNENDREVNLRMGGAPWPCSQGAPAAPSRTGWGEIWVFFGFSFFHNFGSSHILGLFCRLSVTPLVSSDNFFPSLYLTAFHFWSFLINFPSPGSLSWMTTLKASLTTAMTIWKRWSPISLSYSLIIIHNLIFCSRWNW